MYKRQILGWAYQGETAFAYLTHGQGRLAYRLAYVLAALWGAGARLESVYLFSDVCNALMAMPNLLCLMVLSGDAVRAAHQIPGGHSRRSRNPLSVSR